MRTLLRALLLCVGVVFIAWRIAHPEASWVWAFLGGAAVAAAVTLEGR